jgi:hypothetical protein
VPVLQVLVLLALLVLLVLRPVQWPCVPLTRSCRISFLAYG